MDSPSLSLDLEGLPEFLRPKLRLFLSVDVVGSTAAKQKEHNFFKQASQRSRSVSQPSGDQVLRGAEDGCSAEADYNHDSRWLKTSVIFYEMFGKEFGQAWNSAVVEARDLPYANSRELLGPRPQFWKAAGDEILFYKEITEWIQVPLTIGAWVAAMKTIRQRIKEAFGSNALDVKGSAWIAGFPVVNMALSVAPSPAENTSEIGRTIDTEFAKSPVCKNLLYTANLFGDKSVTEIFSYHRAPPATSKEAVPNERLDFIGPLIDLGFRISQHADTERMAVSMEVVHALIRAYQRHRGFCDSESGKLIVFVDRKSPLAAQFPPMRFSYAGRFSLKGIAGSAGYPLFHLDVDLDDAIFEAERKLRDAPKSVFPNTESLIQFCGQYFCDHSVFAWPYLVGPDGTIELDTLELDEAYLGHIGQVVSAHQERLDQLKALWKYTHALLMQIDSKLKQQRKMSEENDKATTASDNLAQDLFDVFKTLRTKAS